MKTLLITDIQNDFLPGGALEVPGSGHIVAVINDIQSKFDLVIASQDWHPPNHSSFASNHPGKKLFEKIMLNGLEQILWPDHCVQKSFGADFHASLETARIEAIFRKGTSPEIDSYSCFFDNAHKKSIGLSGYLKDKGAHEIYFCGLAADFCVYYSIMDAVREGFSCHLVSNATFPIDQQRFEELQVIMKKAGVIFHTSNEL